MPIRAATAADVPHVLPMVRAICAQHEAWDAERYGMLEDVVERYACWLPQRTVDARSVFLVVEGITGGTPVPQMTRPLVGFLIGEVEDNIPIFRVAQFGFIHDVWVEPAARGRGLGRLLVEEALRRFAAMGVGQVRLETALANEGARRVFAACGFRVGTVDMIRVFPETGGPV